VTNTERELASLETSLAAARPATAAGDER
jgi:hypothetical protein